MQGMKHIIGEKINHKQMEKLREEPKGTLNLADCRVQGSPDDPLFSLYTAAGVAYHLTAPTVCVHF